MEGFTGRSSLLYHLVPPTQTHKIEPVGPVQLEKADDGWHHHRLVKTGGLPARGHIDQGRVAAVLQQRRGDGRHPPGRIDARRRSFYRNGDADEMLFFHEGSGVFESVFGNMRYGPGDYIVIPIGTTWRLAQDAGVDHRILYVESPSEIVRAQALPQRLRPAARALAVLPARHPRARRRRAERCERATSSSTSRRAR